ncbi:MAG TPA: cysteine desulfurase family protein [Alphaproteobacteria bacterium]|nr:cysteine desulfurase family protein [Alphaproteobacteria bacterium]
MPSRVYLDHNAAVPLRAEARDAIAAALGIGANPSSVHAPGRAARAIIEHARKRIASLAGVAPESIVFTSGATEANSLALKGASVARRLVSAVEHVSVPEATDVEQIPVDGRGIVDLEALARMLDRTIPALVSVMAANNETGVIQPIAEVARIAHDAGALVHCDAAQAPGRIALAPIVAVCDLVSLSSPKVGGPQGSGALIVRAGVDLKPQIMGGGQERRLRGGTENLSGIAGFGAAADAVMADASVARVTALRDRLEADARILAPEAIVIGADAPRLANTSALALPGIPAESQILSLDLAGIAVGAGAACSSGKIGRSHVLAAMGVPEDVAAATIRVSLGATTTDADVDAFLAAWSALRARARANRSAVGGFGREVA